MHGMVDLCRTFIHLHTYHKHRKYDLFNRERSIILDKMGNWGGYWGLIFKSVTTEV